MSKYCRSCGAANANTALVCTRCGKKLGEEIRTEPIRTLPLKYHIGGIAMFVCAGILFLMMIISLSNIDEYMRRQIMRSLDIPNVSSLEQMKAIYIGSVLGSGLIDAGIYLHCGMLLRKTQLRGKGWLIFYIILFGVSVLINLISLGNADHITMTNIFSLGCAVGALILSIMKCHDWEMARRNTYH